VEAALQSPDQIKFSEKLTNTIFHWFAFVGLFFALAPITASLAADWPTYRADYARSGISLEKISTPLNEAWTFKPLYPPQPAWSGEAKLDAYNKVYDMRNRQPFDKAFHVAVADGSVCFGSSADDKVYCLDAATGKERWTFFTEGPVRLAPTFHTGKVYAGSDDGFVYCLAAQDGAVIWKTRIGPRDYRIAGNGRVISAWPVRTSVVVRDGLAYCCGGMFPSEGVFLCALEAQGGAVKWKVANYDLPAQGYLLASDTRLYVPAGRDNPVVYDRADGRRLRAVEGAGGTYALLTGDTLIFGPGKTGQLGVVPEEQKDQLATFQGNHMIVTPRVSYLHSDKELSALDRGRYLSLAKQKNSLAAQQGTITKRLKDLERGGDASEKNQLRNELSDLGKNIDRITREMAECVPWKQPCEFPFCLILAGETLFAGGDNEIAAFSGTDGKLIWKGAVTGKAYGLAAASGRIFASTDLGTIHCFVSGQRRAEAVGK